MTRRERVRKALRFEPTDQVPKDLGAMLSTCVSCFAYPGLVSALGLPYRPPRVFDTGQMLALPDPDVLDALDCDCAFVSSDSASDVLPEPERWKPYDFGGRLSALVLNPNVFVVQADGSIVQNGSSTMVPASFVFSAAHGGQLLDLSTEPPRENLEALARNLKASRFTPERVAAIADYCRRSRAASDRAIMFSGLSAGLGFRNGMASFSMLCMMDPGYVKDLHCVLADHAIAQAELLLPAIAPYVDALMLSADDQGMQQTSILPPDLYHELFTPAYRRINDACHRIAPDVFTFYHCCGAIYDLLDAIIESGFDALNPVQWSAGGHSFREWKDRCRKRITLWGGGVNTQATLPLGTLADIEREVAEVVEVMSADSGFIFCAIHNLLAEIPPEKILTLYRTAARVRPAVR
jgi:uroporphyrinogen decarboxylase